jgi:protease-4
LIVGVGTGGGYYAASGCDTVFAHPTSIVGGVGVILNVYNLQDTMGQFNILSSPIKAGEKIDAGTPERPIDQDEMEMLQQIADAFHDRFIERIQTRRPQAAETAAQWSDGRVMTGPRALELGLVDQIGYVDAAIDWARQQAGMGAESGVVMFRRENDDAYTPLDSDGGPTMLPALIPLRIPGLDRSSMPTFLYLWQSDPAMASRVRP